MKIAVWRVGLEKRPKRPFPGRFGQKFTSKTPLIIEFYINIGFQKFPKFLFSSFAIRPNFTQTLKLHSSAYTRVSRSKPLPGEGPFYWLSYGTKRGKFRGDPLARFWTWKGVTFRTFLPVSPKFWKILDFFFVFSEGPLGTFKMTKKIRAISHFWGKYGKFKNRAFWGLFWVCPAKTAISRPIRLGAQKFLHSPSPKSPGHLLGHQNRNFEKTLVTMFK